MSSNFNPTEIARKVLGSVRQVPEANLFSYSLSGLCETRLTHCRAFISRSTSRHSEGVTYQFEIINDSGQGLPHRRDALVIASFLLLLQHHQSTSSTVHFREDEIIEELRRPENAESKVLMMRGWKGIC